MCLTRVSGDPSRFLGAVWRPSRLSAICGVSWQTIQTAPSAAAGGDKQTCSSRFEGVLPGERGAAVISVSFLIAAATERNCVPELSEPLLTWTNLCENIPPACPMSSG